LTAEEAAVAAQESKMYRQTPPKLNDLASSTQEAGSSSLASSNAAAIDMSDAKSIQSVSSGFFRLDFDCRTQVYRAALRPDCRGRWACPIQSHVCEEDFEGCTNVLVLSSRVYNEAIEVLHTYENTLDVIQNKTPLFQNMRDFPRPYTFRSRKKYDPYIHHVPCASSIF
jgi:hypothetical protein